MKKFKVKVIPNAKRNEIVKTPSCLVIRVSVSPVEGRANKKALELLADYLNIPKSTLEIIRGAASREKTIQILDTA